MVVVSEFEDMLLFVFALDLFQVRDFISVRGSLCVSRGSLISRSVRVVLYQDQVLLLPFPVCSRSVADVREFQDS